MVDVGNVDDCVKESVLFQDPAKDFATKTKTLTLGLDSDTKTFTNCSRVLSTDPRSGMHRNCLFRNGLTFNYIPLF